MFCLISTEVAITSQVLWTEVLMGWVEELVSGVIRRTAALLMMMIWTTKGRQGWKTVNIRAAIYTCFHDKSVKSHSMVIHDKNIFPEFKVYFYPEVYYSYSTCETTLMVVFGPEWWQNMGDLHSKLCLNTSCVDIQTEHWRCCPANMLFSICEFWRKVWIFKKKIIFHDSNNLQDSLFWVYLATLVFASSLVDYLGII